MPESYDVIIIGAGQAGGPLASAFARAGKRVVLAEATHVGGTCINEGCTPTKTMVASARVAYLARRAADYGVQTGTVSVDLEVVRKRKRDIVAEWSSGSEEQLRKDGVDLVFGTARFTGHKIVEIALNDGGARAVTAETMIINAGARPSVPEIEGLDTVEYLNSTTIMELGSVPEHLVVLGGGYIALEFGQMFRRFGSQVTIVQRGERLLGREDADVADAVAAIMREDGIAVLLGSAARKVARSDDGGVQISVATPDGQRTIAGSQLLVAVGRTPNSDRLDLKAGGIEVDKRGNIVVNAKLATSVAGVYALGDINGGAAFTHISYDDYRILKANLLDGGDRSTDGRLVPYTMYTDPQLARVGLGEDEARTAGRAIRVATMQMSSVARAIETDETRGMIKAVIAADSDAILGFTMLGIEGGEIMSAVQLAMQGGLPYTALRDAVFAHPTLAEALNNLFADLK